MGSGPLTFIPEDGRADAAISPSDPLPVTVASVTPDPTAAREATLLQVRDHVDTVESVLASIRDNGHRSSWERRGRDGFAFLSNTGRLQLTGAGHVRGTFANPVGSGRLARIWKLTSASSQGPSWASLLINPTTGLPATPVRRANNSYFGHPQPAVCQLKADTDTLTPLGGGVDSETEIGIFVGRNELVFNALTVPAGVTLGIRIPYAAAADASFTLYWWEE